MYNNQLQETEILISHPLEKPGGAQVYRSLVCILQCIERYYYSPCASHHEDWRPLARGLLPSTCMCKWPVVCLHQADPVGWH